ncbi:NAD(P)-binding domain-containing protein [Advenella mimigardefordensis]|uniref:Putative NAD-binding 6-phosphopgluconate dehydrogenase n=1 Tax=Advenella mimigardefordensis (strain DSM 17166 / LMG 22922 / DPN7) TaxID=1247726 RepID=W0PFV6_ADVMD|nr:NAD(P)-binding domain-containing protein [Advenella mimigardefordensis]AHG64170.1 putative NAD-binding 6-phosphopgluconate dehydrogenase [Advenella mimigardefordensis DPN7]
MTISVGYIGLGAMGGALAEQLVSSTDLHVWDLNTAACERFGALGASAAKTAVELAHQCRFIFLCLPRSSDVKSLIFDTEGFVDALIPGTVLIDQTSGIPEQTRSIAKVLQEKGVYMLDAPVAGGVPAAQAGRITMMVSGPVSAYEKTLPILQKISPTVIRCGEQVGNGQAIKIINNTMNASCRIALFETMALGQKLGLPLTKLADAINASHACSRLSQVTLTAFLQGKSSSNFALSLMVKDVHQAILLANASQTPLPIASLSRAILEIAVNTAGPASTLEDVADIIASMAGTKLSAARETGLSPDEQGGTSVSVHSRTVGYVGSAESAQAVQFRTLGQLLRLYDPAKTIARSGLLNGIMVESDLASLAHACDLIIIGPSLGNTDVMTGPQGLISSLSPGTIVIDQTTRQPEVSRKLALDLQSLDVTLLDAPICSETAQPLPGGTGLAVVGGSLQGYQAVKQVLENASIESIYMGPSGAGNTAKLLLDSLETSHQLITLEAVSLALNNELDIQDLANVIMKGTGWSKAFEIMLVDHRHNKAEIRVDLATTLQRLSMVSALAFEAQAPMLIANTVRTVLMEMDNQSEGIANMEDLMLTFKQRAGIKLEEYYW